MVNKKLHWVAVTFLVFTIFSFVYGIYSYLDVRDPNKFPEAQEQTISQKDFFKVEIREFSRDIGVWQNTKNKTNLDVLIITAKNNFKFISIAGTSSNISNGGQYIFSKAKTYSGITETDIRSAAENYTETKLNLPILYFEGKTNTAASSAMVATAFFPALFGTIAIFSYIYSRESKKIIIANNSVAI